MDELISRQAALEEANEWLHDCFGVSKKQDRSVGLIRRLEDLPPAQPEPQWIPCNEFTGDGYPEEDCWCFVTEQNYGFYLDADVKQKVVHTCWFKDGDFVDRFYSDNTSNIVAWMPLPDPYSERGQE